MKVTFEYNNIKYILSTYVNPTSRKPSKNYFVLRKENASKGESREVYAEILEKFHLWDASYQTLATYKLGNKLQEGIRNNSIENEVILEDFDIERTPVAHNKKRKQNTNNALKPHWKYRTTEPSNLTPREFYNKIKELLEEKYHNLVWPALSVEESNRRLEKYYHLTDELDDWIYKHDLHLNFDTPMNQRNYLFAQFVYHSGNKSFSGLRGMVDNVDLYNENFNNFDVDSFYVDCLNNPNEIKNRLRRVMTETSSRNNKIVNKYFNLYKNISCFLHGKSKEEILSDFPDFSDRQHPEILSDYLLDKVGKGNGFGFALCFDYIKELDDRFNFLFKPDLHVVDFLDNYYGKGCTLTSEDALVDAINLVEDINRDNGEEVIGYKLDRMIYLLGSGNFFLDRVEQDKTKASCYKWTVVLPQINDRRA